MSVDDPYAWEQLTSYEERLVDERLRSYRRRPRGRVRLEDDPRPSETESVSRPEPTSAKQLERAHASFAEGDFLMAGVWAADVVRRASSSDPQRADALRVQAMAYAESGDLDGAIEAAEQALALEPDGRSVEVRSVELEVLIPLWRSWLH